MIAGEETQEAETFYEGLVEHGLIIPSEIPGGYGRGAVFEDILQGFNDLVSRITKDDGAERMMFPPIVPRTLVEKVGYIENFPCLCGSINSFFGSETKARELRERVHAGERWEGLLDITEAMLMPAACYPVYPMYSGTLPPGGRLVTLTAWVYRHEPSPEPTRLQSFRVREFVCIGSSEQVLEWRDTWVERGLALLKSLQLPVFSDVANDPFFGRAGKMMAANQRDQRLKFEIVCPVMCEERPTALCSFNLHQNHFGDIFDIKTPDGKTASTACLGFGLERVTLALIKTHGFDPRTWPASVRSLLWQ